MATTLTAAILGTEQARKQTMNHASIMTLLSQIQSGDEAALLALYDRYANAVYSVALRVLNSQQDAEEVTQDVFMRLWDKAASFDPKKGQFVSWLLTITRRIAIDRLRKRTRREPPPNTVSMDEKPYLWETLLVTDDTNDLQRTLLSALRELPDDQRNAIQLAYFQGMSHTDIAEYLDKPLGTVKSYIRLGMQKLRAIWLNQQPAADRER